MNPARVVVESCGTPPAATEWSAAAIARTFDSAAKEAKLASEYPEWEALR